MAKGTKTKNFPVSSFIRSDTYWTKCKNTLLVTYKKVRKSHFATFEKTLKSPLALYNKVDNKTFRTVLKPSGQY